MFTMMSGDIKLFLEDQKLIIHAEKERLGLLNREENEIRQENTTACDNEQRNNKSVQSEENKENTALNNQSVLINTQENNQNQPIIERNDLNKCNEAALEDRKQIFVAKLVNCEGPFSERSDDSSTRGAMLRYGEYSPNNPQLRVTAAPYLGVGEYEQRRNLFLQRQKTDYLRHLAEIQYDLLSNNSPEKELSPRPVDYKRRCSPKNRSLTPFRVDQRLTSAQNALLNPHMDKPKSILSNRRTGSPRARYASESHQSSYPPSFLDGFSHSDPGEELARERSKRDSYQRELRLQIEEKRRMQAMRDEQEWRERELENKRLEQQLLRMQEERAVEEQIRTRRDEQMRRHSEDLMRRKQEIQSRQSWRKHTESESSLTGCLRNSTDVSSKPLSHYSPPVSRRTPYSYNIPSTSVFAETASRYNPSCYESSYHRKDTLNRMDSLNTYDTVPGRQRSLNRFDSLSRIDSLNQRIESMSLRESLSDSHRRMSNPPSPSNICRHSATQQDLSVLRKSPRLRRRSSSSRFEDSLPIPVLKAHSPVAKELKNSVPFSSTTRLGSDAIRKLEDKWQIPAVQKNIMNHSDSQQSRSILTQLGAIRMQLQQEQLRMDETLRKRGITQSKAVDFH